MDPFGVILPVWYDDNMDCWGWRWGNFCGMGIGMKLWGLDEDVKSMGMVETGKLMVISK